MAYQNWTELRSCDNCPRPIWFAARASANRRPICFSIFFHPSSCIFFHFFISIRFLHLLKKKKIWNYSCAILFMMPAELCCLCPPLPDIHQELKSFLCVLWSYLRVNTACSYTEWISNSIHSSLSSRLFPLCCQCSFICMYSFMLSFYMVQATLTGKWCIGPRIRYLVAVFGPEGCWRALYLHVWC